ncbi:MAG: M1 family metallopeptidase [Planctomycetota bacterium]
MHRQRLVRVARALPLALPLPAMAQTPPSSDIHSFAEPAAVAVEHIGLDLTVDFERRELRGHADLRLKRTDPRAPAILDGNGLILERVEAVDGAATQPVAFALGEGKPHMGRPITVDLPPGVRTIRVTYRTSPEADALQWLQPEQTHDREAPFLYTQGQAILTRTWIPLQDSPGVRVTYDARVRAPRDLTVLMSAERTGKDADGAFTFTMQKPIPPYLIAMACGSLGFQAIGERCGVWTEPGLLPRAARELEDMERMLVACEGVFGPYRWGRYEVLVLPPAFPFGGMENPRLTFATPTILAGDKSLVALIAHELAHSWSGNLVTNATWRDFWLNEGFTVFLEHRIMEIVYGKERADMDILLGLEELASELKTLPASDQVLHIDLAGRNPDDNMTAVPYEKGAAFLHRLEQVFGRPRLDAFLHAYFDAHAFQSITTEDFLRDLQQRLLATDATAAKQIDVDRWVRSPGLPDDVVRPASDAFAKLDDARARWLDGSLATTDLGTAAWTPQLWLRFLGGLPAQVEETKLAELDRANGLTKTGNSEIFAAWAVVAIRNGYAAVDDATEAFLLRVGRRKFLKPLYEALAATETGKARARAIYARARPRYHAVSTRTLDEMLK